MRHGNDEGGVVYGRLGGVLLARLVGHLHGQSLRRFQSDLLEAARADTTNGLVLDMSAVDLLDEIEFEGLRDTVRMLALLGVRTVLCGLQPALVAALVETEVLLDDLETARTLEDATVLASSRSA